MVWLYPTLKRSANASTVAGMRRILKKPEPVVSYIQKAVESGVYRSREELDRVWKERRESADDLRNIMERFRQDIVRGTNVHDYPTEYLILRQNPPIPDPPRVPKKLQRRLHRPTAHPTERLVKKYLRRQEQQDEKASRRQGDASDDENTYMSTDEYYRRLLGSSAARPSPSEAMGQKSAAVQKAYAAAMKHYYLQRTEGLSDEDAMKQVDALLAQQDLSERKTSRQRAQQTQQQQWPRLEKQVSSGVSLMKRSTSKLNRKDTKEDAADPFKEAASATAALMESIFGADPRTVEGMMKWSERLHAVPYRQWTLGASVALDHWIARRLLGLSEETWQSLLEGDDPSLLSRGRDIVAVREVLFPETRLGDDDHDRKVGDDDDDLLSSFANSYEDSAKAKPIHERSIEELLASLGGLSSLPGDKDARQADTKEESSSAFSRDVDTWTWDMEQDAEDLDKRVQRLVDELQEWRQKKFAVPYEKWPTTEQERFMSWMKTYVSSLAANADRGKVDYESTREALLSHPPVSREESENFWGRLANEEDAMALLDSMRRDGPPKGANVILAAFWDLPYELQLERLLNLGAVRPLLDEYTKESDRLAFLHRHVDTLLSGVELEHLVEDPNGPLGGAELGGLAVELGFPRDARFRMEARPFKSLDNISADEKTRALYKAWNQFKAGRARYEEKLFTTYRLGLRYSDIVDDED